MEGKREEAIDLYSRLLQNMQKNSRELEGYPGKFCLIAYNCAINLTLAGQYKEALELAQRGQRTGGSSGSEGSSTTGGSTGAGLSMSFRAYLKYA